MGFVSSELSTWGGGGGALILFLARYFEHVRRLGSVNECRLPLIVLAPLITYIKYVSRFSCKNPKTMIRL